MPDLIECNPNILGGKPVIKGTRIPVNLIFELIDIGYSLDEIQKEYPSLNKKLLLKIVEIGKDIINNL